MRRVVGLLAAALLALAAAPATGAERPAVTIVIDDLGDRARAGTRVAGLTAPVVCAVLPHTRHGARQARQCHDAGKEVMLHLPMQAIGDAPPGPGAVTLDMRRGEFSGVVRDNLAAVPHALGVNNHMGSLLTQHPGHMAWLMDVLAEEDGLLFLDSRTTPGTVAAQMAAEANVPVLARDVFLDHHREPERIRAQLRRLVAIARREGTAVGIGHPHAETLEVLEHYLDEFAEAAGVELVGLRELYRRRSGE